MNEKSAILIEYIRHLFSEIRGDWSDPRNWCREGWEAVSRLKELNGLMLPEEKPYRHNTQTDDEYYNGLMEILHPKELGK